MGKRTEYYRNWERANRERRNEYHRNLYAKRKFFKEMEFYMNEAQIEFLKFLESTKPK